MHEYFAVGALIVHIRCPGVCIGSSYLVAGRVCRWYMLGVWECT